MIRAARFVGAALMTLGATAASAECDGGRATRMAAALEDGFGVQYWGEGYDADTLAAAPHGLLIVEAARIGAPDSADGHEVLFTPDEMRRINHDGARPVLVYLNLTEVEPWRDYWPDDGSTPVWVGPETASGDKLAAFWRPEWEALLRDRVRRLLATGANGLFLDDALNYFAAGSMAPGGSGAPADVPGAARTLMALVQSVASEARKIDCDALIVMNNGVFLGRDAGPASAGAFRAVTDAVDGILVEDALGGADHPDLHAALTEDWSVAGVPILTIDYAGADAAAALADRARRRGYRPYIAPNGAFSQLFPSRPLTP